MSMLFKRIKDWATSITAFRTGDVIPVDGPSGTAKMSKDDLLKEAAQSTLAGNVAPAFDETGATTYSVGTLVSRGGKTYVFKVNHSGAWNSSDVYSVLLGNADLRVINNEIIYDWNNNPADLNDFKNNVIIRCDVTSSTQTLNFPSDYVGGGLLIVTRTNWQGGWRVLQKLTRTSDGAVWYRNYTWLTSSQSGSWSDWTRSQYLQVRPDGIVYDWNQNPANLNDFTDSRVIRCAVSSGTQTLNFPSDYVGDGILTIVKSKFQGGWQAIQRLVRNSDGYAWTRIYTFNTATQTGSWGAWSMAESGIIVKKDQIFSGWGQNPADLNDITNNVIYQCLVNDNTQTLNLPTDYIGSGTLVVTRTNFNGGWQVHQQLTKTNDGTVWYRTYTYLNSSQSGSWNAWNKAPGSMKVRNNGIIYDWNANPADLNDLKDNVIIGCIVNSSTQTLHFPADYSGEGFLICLRYYFNGGYRVLQKLTRNVDGATWYRIYVYLNSSQSGSWGAWAREPENANLVTIGAGKMYSRMRDGFEVAFNIPNCKVVVYPGVYDLTVECADILETTLTANYCPCKLGNGMHVEFMEGAKVTCNIEKGEMSDAQFNSIKEHFEPMAFYFNGDNGDFTLENAVIESKNCRYCVHDDQGGTTKPYIHKYINCRMYRTNSNITPNVNFVPCIGGGLGKCGTIVIDGGWYLADPVIGNSNIMDGDLDYQQNPIAYHNGNVADAQSFITIKDVYFADKGYFQTQDYGPSTLKTKCYISGCRFGLPPMVGVRTETTNFELTAEWNNSVAVEGEWRIDPEDSSKRIFVASNT